MVLRRARRAAHRWAARAARSPARAASSPAAFRKAHAQRRMDRPLAGRILALAVCSHMINTTVRTLTGDVNVALAQRQRRDD